MAERLKILDIHTWETGGPADMRWGACLGEYDEGTRVFTGPTQRKAVDVLLDDYEQQNGELHQ